MRIFAAAALAAGLAPPALAQDAELSPPEERNCRVVGTTPDDSEIRPYGAPDLSVLEGTQAEGPFRLDAPEGFEVQAVLCERSTLIPAARDFEVPLAGYPLFIDTYDADGAKTGVSKLEYADGAFTHSILFGELTEAEQGWTDHRLRQFNAAAGGASE